MNAGAHTDGGLSAVPLLNAVFCADCETISNSPHDACTVCGSRSLVNLFRISGGLCGAKNHSPPKTTRKRRSTIWNSRQIA